MIRALAPGGALFLETPNYLFPREPHLGLWMLPKSPKAILRLECLLTGRDPAFVDHLQFACDALTLRRWARAEAGVVVYDLAAEKTASFMEGRGGAATPGRRRALAVIGRAPALAWGLRRLAPRMPFLPSVQLLIVRSPH